MLQTVFRIPTRGIPTIKYVDHVGMPLVGIRNTVA